MNDSNAPISNALQAALSSLRLMQHHWLPHQVVSLIEEAIGQLETANQQISASEEQARLAALYRVGQVLGTSLDLDEVLNHVMDAAIRLTRAERGFLILGKPGGEYLDVKISRNVGKDILTETEYKFSHTVIQAVFSSGEGVLTSNAQEDPRFAGHDSVASFDLRSILCVPLQVRGAVMGVVYVDNRTQAGRFTEDDLYLLNTFAAQAASAISNAQQYTQTNKVLTERVNELEELVRFSRVVHTRNSLPAVLDDICQWVLSGTRAEQTWAAVFDTEGETPALLRVISGPEAGTTFPISSPLIAATLEGSTPHLYEPTATAPARLVVPLLDETKVVGVLVAESQTAFTAEELNFLTRLTNLAAGAIGKIDLLGQVQEFKAERAKFVSTVSHELRLPMTSIMGYTDLLKQGAMGAVNENQLNFLNVIRENVGRMARLVSDLSDIYKAEGGRLHIDVAPVSLLQVVKNASEPLESQLGVRGQKLEILVPEELPAVKADPKRAAQMVQYLLENASLYSPEGAPIEARASMVNGSARLMIVDRGIGIAPEDQTQMFTQFFRSEDEAVREHKGWGLSLCVVKSLSKLMDGEVGYETEPGSGSTFWVTLPLMG